MNSFLSLRRVLASFAVAALLAVPFARSAEEAVLPAVSPTEALTKLQRGNEYFATHPMSDPKPIAQRRTETALKQHPFAIIVDCADSRVGPETIFNQTIGDLFVVRVAGNIVDAYGLGSIEYAVKYLGARLIVVIGHQRCGAVDAAIGMTDAPGHIGNIVRDLQPAVAAARRVPGDLLKNATEINAQMVAAKIKRDADFGPIAPDVVIVTGYYSLDSGKIEWAKK
jgi:carbonic anhydrase